MDRLTSAPRSAGDDFTYTYDPASNITSRTVNTATPTKYKYNEANQLCWRHTTTADISGIGCGAPPTGATVSTYDADGNEVSVSGGRSSTWNRRSQLTSLASPTAAFEYAGPGQDHRIKLDSTDIVNNVLGVASYTTGATADYFTRDEAGTFVSQRRPSASAPNRRTYPLVDALGSTRTLIDENATVVRRLAYEPGAPSGIDHDCLDTTGDGDAATPDHGLKAHRAPAQRRQHRRAPRPRRPAAEHREQDRRRHPPPPSQQPSRTPQPSCPPTAHASPRSSAWPSTRSHTHTARYDRSSPSPDHHRHTGQNQRRSHDELPDASTSLPAPGVSNGGWVRV
jgi:YD repeat-containing protein